MYIYYTEKIEYNYIMPPGSSGFSAPYNSPGRPAAHVVRPGKNSKAGPKQCMQTLHALLRESMFNFSLLNGSSGIYFFNLPPPPIEVPPPA